MERKGSVTTYTLNSKKLSLARSGSHQSDKEGGKCAGMMGAADVFGLQDIVML